MYICITNTFNMIYLIKCAKTDTCKIGYTSNPENRLIQLQTGNPFPLELISTIEGGLTEEKQIHSKFEPYRLKGEWFQYTTEIKDYFKIDEFMLIYSSLLSVFMEMGLAEIRIYGYLLKYSTEHKIDISKKLRMDIAKATSLNERSVYNTIKILEEKRLVFKHDGLYRINPKYAFRGSSYERANELKLVLEMRCPDC